MNSVTVITVMTYVLCVPLFLFLSGSISLKIVDALDKMFRYKLSGDTLLGIFWFLFFALFSLAMWLWI